MVTMGSNYRFDGGKKMHKIMKSKLMESGYLENLEGDR
jgi:hypothetical protein